MFTTLIVIHLIVAIAMVVVILLQRSEGGALGIGGGGGGGGGMGGFMTGRATANLLTRITAILAVVFMLNSLALALLADSANRPTSILDAGAPETEQAPLVPTPGEIPQMPAAPLAK